MKMSLKNGKQTAANVFEFDVTLKGTGVYFDLVSLQLGILYNSAVLKKGGTLTAAWVAESADQVFVTSGQTYPPMGVATDGVIKGAAKLPTGGVGTVAVITSTEKVFL